MSFVNRLRRWSHQLGATASNQTHLPISSDGLDETIARIAFLAMGTYLLHFANRVDWSEGDPLWHWQSIVLSYATYGLAFAMLWHGSLSQAPNRRQGWLLAAMLYTLITEYYVRVLILRLGAYSTTDSALFSSLAARLQLAGENPYSWNLSSAYNIYRVANFFMTPTLSGNASALFPYPPLHFLLLVPFKALGVEEMRAPYVIAHVVLVALVFFHAPPRLRSIILLPFLANIEYADYTMGWVTDIVWATLLVAMIIAWKRPTWRAVLFGLACAYKQSPWVLAPFILARLVIDEQDPDRQPRLHRAARFSLIAGGVFLAVNAPYMFLDFPGWFAGVIAPATSSLISFGSGLSTLTQLSIFPFPKEFYTALSLIALSTLLLIYIARFRELKHVLWVFPGIILWFSYRSLQSYFVYWVPILLPAVIEMLYEPNIADPTVADSAIPVHPVATGTKLQTHSLVEDLIMRPIRFWQTWRASSAVTLAGAVVSACAVVGYYYFNVAPLRVELVSLLLDSNVFPIHHMVVRITNTSGQTLTPRVAVQQGSWQPYPWEVDNGPLSLGPGEAGIFTVSTDVPYRMFDLIHSAQIVVTDASGNYALRGTLKFEEDPSFLDPDAIFNSTFLPQPGADHVPWGWGLIQVGANSVTLRRMDTTNGFPAMELGYVPDPEGKDWEYVGLGQDIVFPDGDMQAWVRPPRMATNSTQSPAVGYGLEFDDGQYRLWVLFGKGTGEGYLDFNHYHIFQDAEPETWSQQSVNLRNIYSRLGWSLPPLQHIVRGNLDLSIRRVTVRLLLAARGQASDSELAAQFGPLLITFPPAVIQRRVSEAIDQRSDFDVSLGDSARRQRNYASALEYYRAALSREPDSPSANFGLAESYFWLGDYQQARAAYKLAFRDPRLKAGAYKGLAWVHYNLGNFAEAKNYFEGVLRLDPDSADAYNGLGWFWLQQGRCEAATPLFDIALRLAPYFLEPQRGLQQCALAP